MLPCWFVAFLFCCVSCCYMLLLCMWNVLVVYSMYSFWICEFKKVNKQRNREKFDAPYMGARGFPADLNSHYKQTTSKFICGMSSKGAGVVERCISYLNSRRGDNSRKMAINKINCALITTAKMKKVKFHNVFL